jgi:hypothetical protein
MPPEDFNTSNTKIYFNGKEIPCKTYVFQVKDISNDIDDFGTHFNQNHETTFTCSLSKVNVRNFSKLIGVWDNLKWYQKLWIIITDWFKFL